MAKVTFKDCSTLESPEILDLEFRVEPFNVIARLRISADFVNVLLTERGITVFDKLLEYERDE